MSELLVELINLGMVKLIDPKEAKQALAAGKSSAMSALDQMLDDGRFTSENAAQVLYGSTTPGSFDDMLRVAQHAAPERSQPLAATPTPAPVKPAAVAVTTAPAVTTATTAAPSFTAPSQFTPDQNAQIQSLFDLLEAVPGERVSLKQQVAQLSSVKQQVTALEQKNVQLLGEQQASIVQLKTWRGLCGLLALACAALVYLWLKP